MTDDKRRDIWRCETCGRGHDGRDGAERCCTCSLCYSTTPPGRRLCQRCAEHMRRSPWREDDD